VSIEPATIVEIVDTGFRTYLRRHRAITNRAFSRFEARDWATMRRDKLERIDSYGLSLDATIRALSAEGFSTTDRDPWSDARDQYRVQLPHDGTEAIAETYFNSLARKMFATTGTDPRLEFLKVRESGASGHPPVTRSYEPRSGGTDWLMDLARDIRFHVSWEDINRDVAAVAERLSFTPERIEVVDRLLFRGQAGYVVGALHHDGKTTPFALAIRHGRSGVRIAALLLGEADVSILFSYTRAAFMISTAAPMALVRFLSGILPNRADSELWAAIGFRKQAKTERYRDIIRHLERSTDRFSPAPGVPGLVMIVFTLESYDVVFKVIRDRFPPQKTVTPVQVAERYQLVARHDRAGRLVEAQRFHDLRLPINRFEPDLLEELLTESSRTVSRVGSDLLFSTIYVERRVTPLDMYLRSVPQEEANRAIVDYGTAIKNLAASNIFPGDMLLKNFGVTNRGRVVFYDYDEITELIQCRFRSLPVVEDPLDEMAATPSYGVGPNDVFPEELPRFLGLGQALRDAFDERHADLFEPGFWNDVRDRIGAGEFIEILPYRKSRVLH
jgi:isocitrate dehydrogenase kinase/phosphatase